MSACFCPYVSFCLEFPFFSPSGIHLSRFISSITFLKPPQVLQPSRTMHSLQCLHCSQVRYAPRTDAIDFYLHWIIYRSVSSTHSEQLEGWGHTRLLFIQTSKDQNKQDDADPPLCSHQTRKPVSAATGTERSGLGQWLPMSLFSLPHMQLLTNRESQTCSQTNHIRCPTSGQPASTFSRLTASSQGKPETSLFLHYKVSVLLCLWVSVKRKWWWPTPLLWQAVDE